MDVSRSTAGDDEVLAHLPWVRRLALAILRDDDAAEDVAQDVSRAWLERGGAVLADGNRARGWLSIVTRRLALDRVRSERARKVREERVARPEATDVVERGARQQWLAQAVLELDEPYRSTILLRHLDELDTAEIARRTGVGRPTVRKRLERGRALLRARLERELGDRAGAWLPWLIGAIGPSHAGIASTALAKTATGAGWKGTAIVGAKTTAVTAIAIVAGVAWWILARAEPASGGGTLDARTTVSTTEVPDARAGGSSAPRDLDGVLDPERAERSSAAPDAGTRARTAAVAARPTLGGAIYVDGARVAPPGLAIVLEGPGSPAAPRDVGTARVEGANWCAAELTGSEERAWVTSPSTIPRIVTLPRKLVRDGGVLDLRLESGRELALTFLDRDTRAPLADLAFQVSTSIVAGRGAGRVDLRAAEHVARTDHDGRALVGGLPIEGSVSIRVELEVRRRDVLMRDGKTLAMRWPPAAVWETWLKEATPARLEQTILTKSRLGEAFAPGVLPRWAGDPASLRVVARELDGGDPFVLAHDDRGRFELRSGAPGRHAVWVEAAKDRKHVTAPTEVAFARAGEHDAIAFVPPEGLVQRLRFVHVPAAGEVAVEVSGGSARARTETFACSGRDVVREVRVAPGERLGVRLRVDGSERSKAALAIAVEADPANEVVVDLAGGARRVELVADGVALAGAGTLVLVGVDGDAVAPSRRVLVPCDAGEGESPVHVPPGRWLYFYDEPARAHAMLGVVDVRPSAGPTDEALVIRPRLVLRARAELGAGIELLEIDGVSLTSLPAAMRRIEWKSPGERVAVPEAARYDVLGATR